MTSLTLQLRAQAIMVMKGKKLQPFAYYHPHYVLWYDEPKRNIITKA